ncbi:G-type lectin S-receptor-like serine/threonine-protein kinase SD2-5 [Glycine max]|uniref:G-type lectin S-receptor-like serine/threonine-protein kinase SD2-5 n=2 Tax=Glycine soja TaxID=3848 RepID=A0A445JY82_GLYSO|nr:G-type lectin S-receptor-like serine/threonine-protein kinase SD2-5 [Glycine max]XP_028242268.1 G-type lectin S-receptor-like serine/threonine-protein kinase SD2-5 [Glycine soja]KAH1242626.1 G-type lectin S-receptor-like serine/threonine-protein kinase SD2-5 [Glycine max]RZC03398.1 G-type lectin S-receptor-like serine/threonine-protein kinase SD2-5 [Glycine soja]|eukprot:XP_006584372.1 G-type lectin S-receptor-like serine/threonine-protein kinase SD2-5 [Glycine max]
MENQKIKVAQVIQQMGESGLKPIAFAYTQRDGEQLRQEELILLGLIGLKCTTSLQSIKLPLENVKNDANIQMKLVPKDDIMGVKHIASGLGLEQAIVHEGRKVINLNEEASIQSGSVHVMANLHPEDKLLRYIDFLLMSTWLMVHWINGYSTRPKRNLCWIGIQENMLLDDNFKVKVFDFGLAKLMKCEQSHVFTTLRGTRGYLAPEWITNCAILEKSDVYSYGMVLLEIIGGRKNYDPSETSKKSYFPSFAFKMVEEGNVIEILDSKVETYENDQRVHIVGNVALWCIQEDMSLRPSMTKVVQMLEGLCTVHKPPTCFVLGSRFSSTSEVGTSSGPSDCNSEANLSAVRLSGPR